MMQQQLADQRKSTRVEEEEDDEDEIAGRTTSCCCARHPGAGGSIFDLECYQSSGPHPIPSPYLVDRGFSLAIDPSISVAIDDPSLSRSLSRSRPPPGGEAAACRALA
ncbi:unnamed protein product [Sphagnum balticum]